MSSLRPLFYRLPAPPTLNFLAGLLAGAGINMLTSVATGPAEEVSTTRVVADSAIWILAAIFVSRLAQVVERGQQDADLHIDRDFSASEIREIRSEYLRKAYANARFPLIAAIVAIVSAVLLLPRLIAF
jgi:hypothetical protein